MSMVECGQQRIFDFVSAKVLRCLWPTRGIGLGLGTKSKLFVVDGAAKLILHMDVGHA